MVHSFPVSPHLCFISPFKDSWSISIKVMENANSPIRNTNSPISNGEFGHKYILQNLLEEGMFLSSKSPTLDRPLSSYLHFREPSGLKEVSYF